MYCDKFLFVIGCSEDSDFFYTWAFDKVEAVKRYAAWKGYDWNDWNNDEILNFVFEKIDFIDVDWQATSEFYHQNKDEIDWENNLEHYELERQRRYNHE